MARVVRMSPRLQQMALDLFSQPTKGLEMEGLRRSLGGGYERHVCALAKGDLIIVTKVNPN